MRNTKILIPNLFTTLNIFCGFLSIIHTGDDKFVLASWLIILAGILDVFDGQAARLTKTNSDFGVEFDSLADVISFGVAPSYLLYKVYFYQFNIIGIILSFLPLMCGGIRLARFNILFGGQEKTKFVGLPVPGAAVSFASFIIFNYHFMNELYLTRILIPQLVLVSMLMLSKVEYMVSPKLSFRHSRKNSVVIILLILSIVVLMFFPQKAFYPMIMLYILLGVLRYLFMILKNPDNGKAGDLI